MGELCANAEKLLLRWFNFHLKNHGFHRTVSNFNKDIQDSENYAVLLSEIAKDSVCEEDLVNAFKQKDLSKRADTVLRWAARLGCRKFVTPQDIVEVGSTTHSSTHPVGSSFSFSLVRSFSP